MIHLNGKMWTTEKIWNKDASCVLPQVDEQQMEAVVFTAV